MKKLVVLFSAFFITISLAAYSHPGRLDANGGHYNRKTGEYHYHRTPKSPSDSTKDSTKVKPSENKGNVEAESQSTTTTTRSELSNFETISSTDDLVSKLTLVIQQLEQLTKRIEVLEQEVQALKSHNSDSAPIHIDKSNTIKTESSGESVYVTKTGKKYHREGCRHLKSIAGSMTKQEAEARGYTACSICKP